jgi:hypothetical protein
MGQGADSSTPPGASASGRTTSAVSAIRPVVAAPEASVGGAPGVRTSGTRLPRLKVLHQRDQPAGGHRGAVQRGRLGCRAGLAEPARLMVGRVRGR